jgi:hypothetical protein
MFILGNAWLLIVFIRNERPLPFEMGFEAGWRSLVDTKLSSPFLFSKREEDDRIVPTLSLLHAVPSHLVLTFKNSLIPPLVLIGYYAEVRSILMNFLVSTSSFMKQEDGNET